MYSRRRYGSPVSEHLWQAKSSSTHSRPKARVVGPWALWSTHFLWALRRAYAALRAEGRLAGGGGVHLNVSDLGIKLQLCLLSGRCESWESKAPSSRLLPAGRR